MSEIFRPYKSFPTQKYFKTLPEKEWFGEPNGIATLDENGKLSPDQIPSGVGDSHNKGWFTTPDTLPSTGVDGDYAIVGSTDTVWVWDSDTSAWVDTDTKGQVASVNGVNPDASGNVTITSDNIPDIAETYATKTSLDSKQDKSNLVTSLSSTSTDTQYPSAKAVYTYSQASITSTTEITITPTASQTATSISGALAKKARVVVIPNINNIGAVYIKESSTYSSVNPIYPDPTNNVYEFSNMQNVRIFVDSIGDSVDLVIEYRG